VFWGVGGGGGGGWGFGFFVAFGGGFLGGIGVGWGGEEGGWGWGIGFVFWEVFFVLGVCVLSFRTVPSSIWKPLSAGTEGFASRRQAQPKAQVWEIGGTMKWSEKSTLNLIAGVGR